MNTVAWIHAIFASIFAVSTVIIEPNFIELALSEHKLRLQESHESIAIFYGRLPITHPSSLYIDILCSISFGYFFHDLFVVLYHYKHLPQLPSLLHHLHVVAGILFTWVYRFGIVFAVLALVEDVSTCFLYLGFFLKKTGRTNTLLFKVDQLLLKVTFVMFRFMHNFRVLYSLWIHREELFEISILFFIIATAVFITIGILNTLWLFRLFSSVELFRGDNEVTETQQSPQAGQPLLQLPAAKKEEDLMEPTTQHLEKKNN